MRTVTARMVGWTMVVRPGGTGPIVESPTAAADALLLNHPVRIPTGQVFAMRVRRVLAARALAGDGPDGDGVNWSGGEGRPSER